ncbi:MAG TPA: cytochrome P450 [Aggregatilineales bacterium]|nr:cytochrome P450 [Anaerolineales bacterium]HRE48119.1 cytochrome P450 [Aggregatilineales bacterium]
MTTTVPKIPTTPSVSPQNAPYAPQVQGTVEKLRRLRALRRDPLNYFLSLPREWGDLCYFQLWGLKSIYLNHPQHIHEMLVEKAKLFVRSRSQTQVISRLIGKSILTTDGDFWRRQRKLVQPAFHHKRIAGYADIMVKHTLTLAESWQAGEQRNAAHDMMEVTLAIVAESLFGADVRGAAQTVGKAVEEGQTAVTEQSFMFIPIPAWLPIPQNLAMRRSTEALDAVILPIIAERRKTGKDTGDLLSMLLLAVDDEDAAVRMTDEQVRNEAMTMFLAGHETTANALAWTWYLLGRNPDVEAKLHAELDRVLAGHTPTLDDLPNLPYTEMVIKESMRLYPPAWIITRSAVEDTTLGGFRVPKGTIAALSPYVTHRDPRFFPDPERFYPERFLKENETKLSREAYMPFGDGPHICIGNMFAMMEARLILATLASRYRLVLPPNFTAEPLALIALRPRDGIPVTIVSR